MLLLDLSSAPIADAKSLDNYSAYYGRTPEFTSLVIEEKIPNQIGFGNAPKEPFRASSWQGNFVLGQDDSGEVYACYIQGSPGCFVQGCYKNSERTGFSIPEGAVIYPLKLKA